MKSLLKARYYFHLFLHRYNRRLVDDAICVNLKSKLMAKSDYHLCKAAGLTAKAE
ncbi:hypothetical protein [Neobacillus piezotolerans]|uniref:hypothetical protein n=1 Tax=Neobacillus piezotolerans TaxID=2259171 RepID=UPI0015F142A0|nr:hypothetical protein [Neobacillus piezotolerans]